MDDNVYCHILSGLGAGFCAVVCGSPVDVVKSRLMGAFPCPQRSCEHVRCALHCRNGRCSGRDAIRLDSKLMHEARNRIAPVAFSRSKLIQIGT